MSGLIDKDDAMQSYEKKNFLQGQRHSYFRISIEAFIALTLLFLHQQLLL